MRTTLSDRLPRRRGSRGASRLVMIVISVAVVGTAAALAVPKFLGVGEVATVVAPVAPEVAPAVARAGALAPPDAAAAPGAPRVATSADGDLDLEVTPRIATPVTGTTIAATVRFVNTSLEPFQLPSPGEPHPTLAVVVLDADANEVRRVVETGPDPYPRRTTNVPPGGSMEVPVQIVSDDDVPLPPGEYTIYAELRSDPVWTRLGLPMWKAPKGAVRSGQTPITVLPRE